MPPIFSKEILGQYILAEGQHRQFRTSPCETECLLGNRIQKINSLVEKGDVQGALETLWSRNPFPGITGRVCTHPCESKCNRQYKDAALQIHNLERYASDHADKAAVRNPRPLPATDKSVGIVGAGVAGLSAAYFLSLLGHSVTIYEKSPVMGGAPRQAIPDFRLPKDVVDRECGRILNFGVQVRTNVCVGKDIAFSDIRKKHDICILAAGLSAERRLKMPGEEFLTTAVAWLQSTTLQRESLQGKNVVILGGGGIAFDCAFTAKRLQAKSVSMICLEAPQAMRAPAEEILQAKKEGIIIYNNRLSRCVEKAGKFTVKADHVQSFSFDASGSLHAEFGSDPELSLEADLVICASGLKPDMKFLGDVKLHLTPYGIPVINENGQTSEQDIYAVGDMANGPSLVAKGIASGRKTALSIHKALMNIPEGYADVLINEAGSVEFEYTEKIPLHTVEYKEIMNRHYREQKDAENDVHFSAAPSCSKKEDSVLAFAEINTGFPPSEAEKEASHCIHCGHCIGCGSCVEACPGHILAMDDDGPYVAYPDECWHCGCCRIACPTGSIAYRFPLTALL